MKEIVWRNGNHMLIETGHKTFDRQCDCLSVGNVVGYAQLSSFIRPRKETECNGRRFPEGHLRDFDLGYFHPLPRGVTNYVLSVTEDEPVILYEIRHWVPSRRGERKKVVHGYIVTRPKGHRLLRTFVTGNTYKSRRVIEVASEYLSNHAKKKGA